MLARDVKIVYCFYMTSLQAYRDQFKALYDAVERSHRESLQSNRGHGFDHDLAVAQMTTRLAHDLRTAHKSWVAGIIHSTDRLFPKESYQAQLRAYLLLLPENFFSPEEVEEILFAVLEHDALSPVHQSPTQAILQDADKLVNMQATAILRVGQFRHALPAIELSHLDNKNPDSTYLSPKSALDNLRIMSEENPLLMHTKKGKELARTYADRLRSYEIQIQEDYRFLGLS